MPPTVVSCPGKVLVAGGYLVLEPAYPGLVIGTASRFYTVVSETTSSHEVPLIVVKSPQFVDAEWSYRAEYIENDVNIVPAQHQSSRNTFVQIAVEAALKVALGSDAPPLASRLSVTIVGDNDFYSQQGSPNNNKQEANPFAFLNTTIANVHKTGLGSSAAMVTSLVAALYIHLTREDGATSAAIDLTPGTERLRLIHNVAQYAHSRAQGKVGSGFDVSAAVWQSHLYRRFSPICLESLLNTEKPSAHNLRAGLDPQSPLWREGASTAPSAEPFRLPPLMTLFLADVDAGSNTPSMVSKVLKWRKTEPHKASNLWARIASRNQALVDALRQLEHLAYTDRDHYTAIIKSCSTVPSMEWENESSSEVTKGLVEARVAVHSIRKGMKEMGKAAAVPIEPDEQTNLLDATITTCTGVLGGGVPGAGGYDALWVIVLTPSEVEDETSTENQGSWDRRENATGLQIHRVDDVLGLAGQVSR